MFHTTYNPLNRFSLNQIAPTEQDLMFRKQTIRGFVHDPGAAMMGGVGGHAGVFYGLWYGNNDANVPE